MHHWMLSGMTVTAATVMGLGLGAYVTSPQSSALPGDAGAADAESGDSGASDYAVNPVDHGPSEIRCTGCGPSLAERRNALDMAGLDADGMIDGTGDPVVRDYLTQGEAAEVSYLAPQPPSPVHQLPEPIARFAAGEGATPPPVLQPAQGKASPATVATAAGSSLP
ncbi:hypothetical protein [Sphingobium sp. AS12]|uniref:hypothetical protein n=1 Tax=Sphingobium sp. AS12 TaxID=2849495 RepID=UPI0020C8BBE0|nr:hypothetical protein [Sphingobium sp. AS12]